MTKNKKRLFYMLAAVALLSALLALLSLDTCSGGGIKTPSRSDAGPDDTAQTSHSDVIISDNPHNILLIDRESDDMEGIELRNAGGTYHISRDKSKGGLVINELAKLPVNTDFVELLWYNSLKIGYSNVLTPAKGKSIDLANYGLDDPQVTVKCKFKDGSSAGFQVGDGIIESEDLYYITVDGYEGIYVTEIYLAFFQKNEYWLSDAMFAGTGDVDPNGITISGYAFPHTVTIKKNTIADKSSPYFDNTYLIAAQGGAGSAETVYPADNYRTGLLISELSEFVADEAVCAFPTEQQIKAYGLDKPTLLITHRRGGRTYTLRTAKKDQSTFYAMVDGIDVIYQLSGDYYAAVSSLTPDYLRSADVHIRYFETVESIKVEAGGKANTFRIERKPLPTDSSLYEYYAYCGDKRIELNNFKNLLQVFNSATASSFGGSAESSTPYLTVTIKHYGEFSRGTEVFDYLPAGTRRYVCRVNGSGDSVVTSMWIDRFIKQAENLARGEAVTP